MALLALHRLTLRDDGGASPANAAAPSEPTEPAEGVGVPPKRKSDAASSTGGQTQSAAVVRHDSGQLPVRITLLSRLLGTRDEVQLAAFAATGLGAALLTTLRATFLDAARAIGGEAAQALTPTNVESLFNATGSTLARPPLYEAQLSVPQRLPFAAATVVYRALLQALAAEREELTTRTEGLSVAAWLTSTGAANAATMAHAIGSSIVERTRLALTTGEAASAASTSAASSSAASSSDAMDTLAPHGQGLLPLPMPPPPPPPPPPLLPLLPDATLRDNLFRLVRASTMAPLSDETRRAIDEALERGLELLDPTARPLLDTRLLDALLHWTGAQLLSQLLEALPWPSNQPTHADPVEGVLDRLLQGCSCVAAMRCPLEAVAHLLDEDALDALPSDGDGGSGGGDGNER